MRYEVEEIQDFLIVHVVGNLTLDSHIKILDEVIQEHINDGYYKFLFNLERLEDIDLEGVGIFINCIAEVSLHDGGCYLLVEDDEVLETLTSTGLDQLMQVYRAREEFVEDHDLMIPDDMF